jgi:hypothetical protein
VARPYLNSLLAYLVHPSVSATQTSQESPAGAESNANNEYAARYEIMIWSSAQPHSVKRMLAKTFGEYQKSLLAVWDRTQLGLSPVEYSQCISQARLVN